MPRTPLPLHVDDLSSFAKALRRQLDGLETPPTHLELLNLLCKAGGYRNFQHFRSETPGMPDASVAAAPIPAAPAPAPVAAGPAGPEGNPRHVREALRHFDADGLLVRWPKKFSIRMLTLWVMWSRIPARTPLTEPELNELLAAQHHFGDHALLRRLLVDHGMVERTADGRRYERREVRPPVDGAEVIRQVKPERRAA